MSDGGETERHPGGAESTLVSRSGEEASFLLASRRTRLSFQRTRMSTDRTLMSIVRTALSLIGFGFTIFQFFRGLHEGGVTTQMVGGMAGRNFGAALVGLGLLILTLGIGGHVRFMLNLRREHDALVKEGLIPHDRLAYSATLAVALLLWLLGLIAIISIVTRLGPLG